MRPGVTALAVTLLALPGAGVAQVQLVEAGIVCPREAVGALVAAPGTESGTIRRIEGEVRFDLAGRVVPTMDDLSFGFRAALKPGAPPVAATIVVTHPPMGPRAVTRQEWEDTIVPGGDSLNLFTFEEEHEKVPGAWTFSIEVDGEPVVTVPFEVSPADGRGAVEAVCFRFLS